MGTLMIRPSSSSAVTVSSDTRTLTILSPALGSEVFMPGLQAKLLMLLHKFFDQSQFSGRKTKIVSDANGPQPKFSGSVISIDMNMRRFTHIVTRKEDFVGPLPNNRGHRISLLRLSILTEQFCKQALRLTKALLSEGN